MQKTQATPWNSQRSVGSPGIYQGVPFDEYLAWNAYSTHDLINVLRSPKHYRHSKAFPPKATPAMVFGTAAHAHILQPEDQLIVVVPESINRRTKAGKEEFQEFQALHKDKIFVTASELKRLTGMATAIREHTLANQYLSNPENHVEESCLWVHGPTGLPCRGRPDVYSTDMVIDLKTTSDTRPEAFSKNIVAFNYHMQAYAYLYGLRKLGAINATARFVFIAVEKLPPYQVEVYELEPEDISRGGELYTLALQEIAHCRRHDFWNGDTNSQKTIGLPAWARSQHDKRYYAEPDSD